jgi:formylglycine-generating enzyme required for sulfatase activity
MSVAVLALLISVNEAKAQQKIRLRLEGERVNSVRVFEKEHPLKSPVLSFKQLNNTGNSVTGLEWKIREDSSISEYFKGLITFSNPTQDTVRLSNVVPFGDSQDKVFITGLGDHPLSRTHLFRSGRTPVNVIVPDNAWELGYSSFRLSDEVSIYGLVRRDVKSIKNGQRRRFETILFPGGSVEYNLYAETFVGEWQEGLRKAFQERKLFDLESVGNAFDNKLFQRQDLAWMKKAYVMHLLMAWDKSYYDSESGKFTLPEFVRRGKNLYGGDDVVCLWPTWPTLGLDQRNQFDMYRDLPGGLPALRKLADTLRSMDTKFFIAYNPWDESTRAEGHLQGLEYLIQETSADGVVLDTKGESSKELQMAADKIKSGVIMYSEGMAVPKDMPGIVAGRVHNALYYPPPLNLNKFIKPDFSIFRVAEVFKEPIRREYATSFFNGYGTEINQFAPGHPDWEDEQYLFLGQTSMILRQNSSNFISNKFTPLVETVGENIWVNAWPSDEKVVYTVLNLNLGGFNAPLFKVIPKPGYHFVDLWNHELKNPIQQGGEYWMSVDVDGYSKKWKGTNNEGSVGCVALLPDLLKVKRDGNVISFEAQANCTIKIWAGLPAYHHEFYFSELPKGSLNYKDEFGAYEGKIVVQAFIHDELLDETILEVGSGEPVLTSASVKTERASKVPSGMVKIPAGSFVWKTTQGDEFIQYPKQNPDEKIEMPAFYMDKSPVTNKQFKEFLDASHYTPSDTANFLKNLNGLKIPKGMENFPVVHISYEDALAYCQWAGKRLPTEIEWQYAAQTSALNEWPWKQTKPVTRKEQFVTETLTVSSLEGIDPKLCNLGDGNLYEVGKYPKGANPFGLLDLTGCVWQLTNDVYESGSYRYIMMKGGSYFKPSSSWWYVQGGPRELHYRQYLLRVSQGFERNATVGFRCVAD